VIPDSCPVDGFKSSLGGVGVKIGTLAGFVRLLAQGLTVEHQAVRRVHEAVEDGVGEGWFAEHRTNLQFLIGP
jgi:hypothetical protein